MSTKKNVPRPIAIAGAYRPPEGRYSQKSMDKLPSSPNHIYTYNYALPAKGKIFNIHMVYYSYYKNNYYSYYKYS